MARYVKVYKDEINGFGDIFTKAEAMLDLNNLADHFGTTITIRSTDIQIDHGEVPMSIRALRIRWGWKSKKSMYKFLNVLESKGILKRQKIGNLFTKIQVVKKTKGATKGATKGQQNNVIAKGNMMIDDTPQGGNKGGNKGGNNRTILLNSSCTSIKTKKTNNKIINVYRENSSRGVVKLSNQERRQLELHWLELENKKRKYEKKLQQIKSLGYLRHKGRGSISDKDLQVDVNQLTKIVDKYDKYRESRDIEEKEFNKKQNAKRIMGLYHSGKLDAKTSFRLEEKFKEILLDNNSKQVMAEDLNIPSMLSSAGAYNLLAKIKKNKNERIFELVEESIWKEEW